MLHDIMLRCYNFVSLPQRARYCMLAWRRLTSSRLCHDIVATPPSCHDAVAMMSLMAIDWHRHDGVATNMWAWAANAHVKVPPIAPTSAARKGKAALNNPRERKTLLLYKPVLVALRAEGPFPYCVFDRKVLYWGECERSGQLPTLNVW